MEQKEQERAINPTLRLHSGQLALTVAQEAEAQRFATERIHAQLSTELVDESATEALLVQAYAVAQLPPPSRIHWVDGPLQLLHLLAVQTPQLGERRLNERVWEGVRERIEKSVDVGIWEHAQEHACDDVGERIYERVWARVRDSLREAVHDSVWQSVGEHVSESVGERVWGDVGHSIHDSVWEIVWDNAWESVTDIEWEDIYMRVGRSVWQSVMAYKSSSTLASFCFFDVYLARNDLHPLAHYNELVSGYRLGSETAIIVRRPRVLTRDVMGWLHSATGKCLEYHDGWGFYAWHGVRVPEKVILAPEQLTREDFLKAPNVEVRRVIQERMGQRFVLELGGIVLDAGSRGRLYEVVLPEDDPEGVAHYVQVQDASTSRTYFLRVPPTIRSADEAVAWSFQLGIEEYHPARET